VLAVHLPNAAVVAGAFHVLGVRTRVVDRTRRRVPQETLGHRGHKDDPLYRRRKLLTLAAERLDDRGTTKPRGLLAAGDPGGQVYEAWAVEEGLRVYTLRGAPSWPAAGSTRSSPTAELAQQNERRRRCTERTTRLANDGAPNRRCRCGARRCFDERWMVR
jgi:hypothetical protein